MKRLLAGFIRLLRFTLFLFIFFYSTEAHASIYSDLQKLPGVYVKKIETLNGFEESYELAVVQPIDHNNPAGAKFTQRVFLSHINPANPVVFETNGYGVPWHKGRELSKLLNANQIIVEHRYYDASKPSPLDWQYLTSWQAASDHHRIIELLRRIYPGKWISTGKSKGGMAALFLEHYYPDDIDATVAFVAPIFDGIKDKRFIPYLNQISGEKERKRIKEFQIDCLERRDSMKSYIQRYLENNRLKYSMSLDSILEWSVIEFPYSFWSGNSDPEKIPDLSSATLKIFNYLNSISIISNFGDSYIKSNYPLLWQVTTEFGYYAYDIKHLDSLLKVITAPDNICFAPASVIAPNFSPEEMQKVLYDLKFSCSNIIYLYGENDIWTAASVNPELTTNSIQIVVKGYAHDFNIVDLAPDDSELVMSTLKSWIQE